MNQLKTVHVRWLLVVLMLVHFSGKILAAESATNTPPSITQEGEVVAEEDIMPAWISYTVNDAESELMLLQVTAHSSNQDLLPDSSIQVTRAGYSGIIRLTTRTNAFGIALITLTITDPQGATSSTICKLTVRPQNDAPSLDAIADMTIQEDAGMQVISLAGIATGATNEFQTLTVSAVAMPSGILSNLQISYTSPNSAGTLSFGTVSNASGTALVTVLVDDGEAFNNVTTRSFLVHVVPSNDLPVISSVDAQVIDEDMVLGPIALHVGDCETEARNLVLSASCSNPTLVPQTGIVLGGSGSDRTVQVLPGTNQSGSGVISLRVRDEGGWESTVSFDLTVRPVNDLPTSSLIGDQVTDEDAPKDIDLVVGDAESRAEDLVVSGGSSNPALVSVENLIFSGTGSNRVLTILPAPNQFGRSTIRIHAQDGQGGGSARSFEFIVNALNDGPTLDPISELTIEEDSDVHVVSLTGISSGAPNENQVLTVTAFSSDLNLVPDPVVNYLNPSSTGTLTLSPARHASGTATIFVLVNDGQTENNLLVRQFTVQVQGVNYPPTVGQISDQVTSENTPTEFVPVIIGDVETPAWELMLTAHSSDPGLLADTNIVMGGYGVTRTVGLIPARDQFGTTTVTLTVMDAIGATATSSFQLTVTPVNQPPTVNPIADVVLAENSPMQNIQLTGISCGAVNENQDLIVTAISSNPGLFASPLISYINPNSNGTLTFTPMPGAMGNSIVTVTVNDGATSNNFAIRTFSVTVLHSNRAPVISGVSNQVFDENGSPGPIPFTLFDQESPPANLLVAASSSNPALVPNSNLLLQGTGANRTLTIFPAAFQSGSATITLSVSDGQLSNSTSFIFTVQPINQPPTLNPLPPVFLKDSAGNPVTVTVDLSGITSGASNEIQALSLTATSSDPSFFATQPALSYSSPNTTGVLTFKPDKRASGTNRIILTVNDHSADNNLFSQVLLVCIRPNANTPPSASGIVDQTILQNTDTAALPLLISDAETPAASLSLLGTSSNPLLAPTANIRFGGSDANRTVTVTPATNQSGSTLITITVMDGNFGGTNLSFLLTVNPVNQSPNMSPLPNQTIAEDASTGWVCFNIGDTETEAESLVVSASSSNPLLIPGANIQLSGVGRNRGLLIEPAAHKSGSATITIMVADPQGATASSSFLLNVTGTNYPPTISSPADQTLAEDASCGPIGFLVQDFETPETDLSVRASSSNPILLPMENISLAGNGTNRTVTLTPAPNQFGTTLITLAVTDGAGASASNHFLLRVNPVNDLPIISTLPDRVTDENVPTLEIVFAIGDVETFASDLMLSASSSNPALVPESQISFSGSGSNRTVRIVPAMNQSGDAAVTLMVFDKQGGMANCTFGLTVNPVNLPPTISPIPNVGLDEDSQTGSMPIVVRDSETPATDLALSAVSSNPSLISTDRIQFAGSGMNRVVCLRPVPNESGSARIMITVTDGGGATASSSFELTVNSINDSPIISPIADQTIQPNTPTAPIEFMVSDAETPASNLVIDVQSSDPMLVPQSGLVLGGSASNCNLTITPTPRTSGRTVVTLTVTDAEGGQASSRFDFSVTQTSFLPIITTQPQGQTVAVGGATTLSVAASLGTIAAAVEALSFQWEHNGQPLPGQTNATLLLDNVATADAGEYIVLVSSCCAAVSSDPASLRVLAPPTSLPLIRTNGVAVIRFTTLPNLNYAVEYKNTLNDPDWTVLDFRTGTGSVVAVHDFGAKVALRFYRVRVE